MRGLDFDSHANIIVTNAKLQGLASAAPWIRLGLKTQDCGDEQGLCRYNRGLMYPITMGALLALQCFHVLFLAFHDWIPLGTLNDVKAVRAENPGRKLLAATLISIVPFAIGLAASAAYFSGVYPKWLLWWLWISYVFLFAGELQAWWIPYLFRSEPERVARYQVMFGKTHAFLPVRNGIRINTLHAILHLATLTTLGVLAAFTVQQ